MLLPAVCLQSYGAANGVEDGKGTFTPAVLAPSSTPASTPAAIAAGDVETPEEAMMIPTTAPVSPTVRVAVIDHTIWYYCIFSSKRMFAWCLRRYG